MTATKKANASICLTDRKPIMRDRFTVNLTYPEEGSPTLNALTIDCDDMGFPDGTLIVADFWGPGLRRQRVELGSMPKPGLPSPVDLNRIGRNSCDMRIRAWDPKAAVVERELLGLSKPVNFAVPDPSEPGCGGSGDGTAWVKRSQSILGWVKADLGPDVTFKVQYPEPGSKPMAVIQVNQEKAPKAWERIDQKPVTGFRKLVLELVLAQMIDRVVEDARRELFDPSQKIDQHSRWAALMHSILVKEAGGLDAIDLDDEHAVEEWKRRAGLAWSSGKATPKSVNDMLGGGY